MSFDRSLLISSLGIVCIAAFAGCSGSDSDSGGATGGAGGAATTGGTPGTTGGVAGTTGGTTGATGGTGAGAVCNTDFTRFTPNGKAASLRADVMPIFGLSCVASGCHGSQDKKAGLYLGPKCDYDLTSKTCVFPTAPNPDTTKGQPLTTEAMTEVFNDLTGNSTTAPALKRAAAGDPANSFIVDKISNTQGAKGLVCTNQDPTHSSNPQPCGDYMPQTGDPLCISGQTGQARFDTIVQWIVNGAQNN